MADASAIISIHTPASSFAIVHSLANESLDVLFDKLTRKVQVEYPNARVGGGWLKYGWRGTAWNLGDDGDYDIAKLRLTPASSSTLPTDLSDSLDIFLHDPASPLPGRSAYCNPAYYTFRPRSPSNDAAGTNPSAIPSVSPKTTKTKSVRSRKSSQSHTGSVNLTIPRHKLEFDRARATGVRTVTGTIGEVRNVRMLLKSDHRHVYVARKFAIHHGMVPGEAAPGQFGYSGLVNIGKWPITLGRTPPADDADPALSRTVTMPVYLSEEPHFDVILGRSFFEARRVRTDQLEPTEVRCLDTGEHVECEVVVLRDGKGEVVTVT